MWLSLGCLDIDYPLILSTGVPKQEYAVLPLGKLTAATSVDAKNCTFENPK